MFKRALIILIVGIFIFGMTKLSFAMMCGSEGEHSSQKHLAQVHSEHEHGTTEVAREGELSEEAVHVGNKICPVSGEKIKGGETYQVEYEGKIYNLCCKACAKDFKKDPEKYIKKIEKEKLQGKSKQEEDSSSESHQHSH